MADVAEADAPGQFTKRKDVEMNGDKATLVKLEGLLSTDALRIVTVPP